MNENLKYSHQEWSYLKDTASPNSQKAERKTRA